MSPANDPFRFRLASLLIGTAMVAFVVYATVQPSVWAASFGFTVALVVLSLALVRAMVSRGERRRYLLAFSLAGFTYLGLLYLPAVDERVGCWMLTTSSFARTEGALAGASPQRPSERLRYVWYQRTQAANFVDNGMATPLHRLGTPRQQMLPQETWAARAFHSMFAIVCGFIAGWVAMLPVRRDFKDDTAAGGVVE